MKLLNLSICIPAYNYGQYLPIAIESCLNNDYDFELVVVDNCSSDNTPSLKNKYVKDTRVKWYTNAEVLPMVQNWNYTVSLAQRKYVKLLLADDYLLPNFFPLFDNAVTNYPDKAIYGHLVKIIDENDNVRNLGVKYSDSEMYVPVGGITYVQMKLQDIARFKETSCNFFLKDKWAEIGEFDKKFTFSFDLVFNSTLAFKYGGCLISDYGGGLRRHSQAGNLALKPDLSVKEMKVIIDTLYEKLGADIREVDLLHGKSLLQYRIIELFFQRFSNHPIDSFLFLFRHLSYFSEVKAYSFTFSTIIRKLKTNDVQQQVEKFI